MSDDVALLDDLAVVESDAPSVMEVDVSSVVTTDSETLVVLDSQVEIIEVAMQGPPGRDGRDLFISTDAGNRLSVGSDGGLFSPELLVDPVEIYLQARS